MSSGATGDWDSYFVPLNVARQPFSVGVAENPAGGVAAQNSSPASTSITTRVQGDAVEALFDELGDDTTLPAAQDEAARGTRRRSNSGRAQFTAKLTELELIHPIQLELKVSGQSPRKITGLYSIDEPKIARARCRHRCGTQFAGAICTAMYRDAVDRSGTLQILARRGLPAPASTVANELSPKEKAPATF